MAVHVALTHRTTYTYDRPVTLGPHVVRLRPAAHTRTPILSYSLRVEPSRHFLNWQQDPFGNYLARLVFPDKADQLEIVVDIVADMTTINPFDFFVDDHARSFPFDYQPSTRRDLSLYLEPEGPGPLLQEWLGDRTADLRGKGMPTTDFLVEVNQRLQHDIAYATRMEPGVQTPEATIEAALGSCRDSGWMLVQVLRNLGLAARFVSGYLVQLTPDVPPLDGPAGPESDFTDLHAWAEVYLPGAGWVGLDATSGLFAGEGHIPLACTPEPRTAAPVEGSAEAPEASFAHDNLVTRIAADPRPSLPYTDPQWDAIDAVGRAVDADLQAADVRLRVAGTPTLVSVDRVGAAEWRTAVDGDHKRERAWDLTRRLHRRFAPGGWISHRPPTGPDGAPASTWGAGIHWRADGQAVWPDPALLADPWSAGTATPEDARALGGQLEQHGVGPVELRNGRLHVRFPPPASAQRAVDLVGVAFDAVQAMGTPVVLEGCEPPPDPLLRRLAVAPTPGAIEVGLPPASTWEELAEITLGLYEDARHARLAAERFHVDGTHTGTGAGSHVTLGGSTPGDAALLRRPALLRSILTYWQHHPSLSYLFSGTVVGAASAAPRIDEGPPGALEELQIALVELQRIGEAHEVPPVELVARALRPLRADATGSARRAEIDTDDLDDPDGEPGSTGLLHLRGVSMPPHPRMAMVQALLLRALVARFLAEPYTGELVRWGSLLHDRFLLPRFAEADAREVVEDLQAHGHAVDPVWLAPFVELRFPRLGTVVVGHPHGAAELELRKALEPGGDATVERLQVRVRGITPGRHIVTCNGVPVPLTPTGEAGTSVAGVRYRARQDASGSHPTIEVHAPLTFDLVDRWNRRSLGGARYHVVHPGGITYEHLPVNAYEADARRASRVEGLGHTPGPIDIEALDRMAADHDGAHPHTLDLRRYPSPTDRAH